MEDGLWIAFNVTLVMFLVLLNGFFVASEFAFVKARGSRLATLAGEGNKRAEIAHHISMKLDAYLSACQLGITLASLGLGWLGKPAIAHLIVEPVLYHFNASSSLVDPVSFGIAFAIITFLHIVLGELAPKSLAIFKAEETSLWLARPLMLFYKITYPAIWLLNGSANRMLSWFGIRPMNGHEAGHTEEEIRILMKESQMSGHIDENELALVENIFDFSERIARKIMIPRTMIECLYTELPFEENLDMVMKRRHTRYPVVQKDKDHIIGVVHVTDVYNAALTQDKHIVELKSLVRRIPTVPESMEISQVLRVMQLHKAQMVVVMDEFGGTAGLITLKDIMEEIVGDIQDERKPERPEIEVLADRTLLDPLLLIEKVNELFDIDINDDEVDTLGGWVYSHLKGEPRVGQKVPFGDIVFEVTELERLRINRIAAWALPRIESEDGTEKREADRYLEVV